MHKKQWIAAAALVAGAFLLGRAVAQEDEGDAGGAGMPGMPAWTQLTEEHAGLKKMVGDWTAESKFWIAPGQDPMVSKATASAKLIFGGRFLQMDYRGDMMGQPFNGLLHVGFDTIAKDFVSVWMDNMSPIVSVSRGPMKGGVIQLAGRDPEWMTGKMQDAWMNIRWLNDDQYVLEMWGPAPDGTKQKGGEIVYTRKK
jgi:hypothetical protein